ncbi:prion protein b [Neoarius graeffei]|uniref:prion protein b n=1 Tax=Neoarius graeffei TaxID=443677 RepID=UPI00298BE25C|nr:prion protein b [Neoarius graeffei]
MGMEGHHTYGVGFCPGGYPHQSPAGGSYPSGGQYPGQGHYNPGWYPNQYPAGGSYPNQYPGKFNPEGYPVGGVYPVRTAGHTSWGQPGGFPGGYPSTGGSYPNWNPHNKILSPRYGGGFGGPGYGIDGSFFSKLVHKTGYEPTLESKGFAKKAVLAAGLGTMTGMAVGCGLGQFPQPHFHFRSRQEEYYYNYYMHCHYGMKSNDANDHRRDYTFKPPPQAQTYETYMDECMNRTDLLQKHDAKVSSLQGNYPITVSNGSSGRVGNAENCTSKVPVPVELQDSDNDTVSITGIGYPALIEQMKTQKRVELYILYLGSFLQKQIQQPPGNHSDPNGHSGFFVLLMTAVIALSSAILLE